jgi:hypothetical protein
MVWEEKKQIHGSIKVRGITSPPPFSPSSSLPSVSPVSLEKGRKKERKRKTTSHFRFLFFHTAFSGKK